MPTYVYRREDGTTFEIEQRITEDALETCPETGQPVRRIITGSAGLVFKGSGFYLTDYARGNGSDGSSGKTSGTDASSSSESKASDKASDKASSSESSSSDAKAA